MPSPSVGPYRLGSRLATGGMGEVWVGVRPGIGQFQKPLALKLLLPHLSDSEIAVQRFLDEARLTARMSHPNVAQVFDVGFADERYFLAMELVRGVSLATLISALRSNGLAASQSLMVWVARALCDGLHHAHELTAADGAPLGVVHRDVSPHNVLVSVDGAVKLTDFGIARMSHGSVETSPGRMLGKLSYMAPEQLRSAEQVDRRADLFGLGATLCALATLAPPFDRGSDVATAKALKEVEPPNLDELRPDLSPELREAILRSLKKNPAERFQSARAMRDALPAATDAADELGTLVRKLCRNAVEKIDEKTRDVAVLRGGGTESGPGASVPDVAPPPRRWWPLVAGLAVFCIIAVAALVARSMLATREPEPVPVAPPAVVVAEPVPVPPPVVVDSPLEPEPEPVAPTPVPVRPTRAKKQTGVGYLSIDAKPWASVFVDGRKVGDTPLAALPVDSGRHQVSLRNPDTGKTSEQTVKVVAGVKTYLKADLR